MNIIGVNCGHNGSACLLVNGKVELFIEEERLSRNKYDAYPFLAIDECLKLVDNIDYLAIVHTHDDHNTNEWTGEHILESYVRKKTKNKFETVKLFDEHHTTHAALAFHNSGFDTAGVIVVDGAGSKFNMNGIDAWEVESVYLGNNKDIFLAYKHLSTNYPVGRQQIDNKTVLSEYLGITKAYEGATLFAGFHPIEAGKTMGLAPYGRHQWSVFHNYDFIVPGLGGNRQYIKPCYPARAEFKEETVPELKDKRNAATLAYTIQQQAEQAMYKLIEDTINNLQTKNIVITGGFGLNCVANYKYTKRFPNINFYCEPISSDAGTSIGAAMLVYSKKIGNKPHQMQSIYTGPCYELPNPDKIGGIDVTPIDIAKLIADGNIVCLFQGRSEAGPRALGNRSILFDPRIKDGKDIVNKIKKREYFRPFAGSMLEECFGDWFAKSSLKSSPHMMYACDVITESAAKIIPSIIHEDGTCRIQTVNQNQNKHYYDLINEFYKITGVPILFNTSFNLAGDALVETLDDAIYTMKNSEMKYLYLPEINKLFYFNESIS